MKTSESAARTLGSLMQRVADVSGKMAKDVDLKRENANVDGDVAMGQMLRFGSETAKAYYLNYLIDPKFAEAHLNGDIHIHDLDFYAMTTTCCQIDLLKLLSKGFSTGHGSLREPQTIGSAAALACIAIQSNQNDQHGGQSIPNFDYGLAPYVEKSFRRNYMDALTSVFEGALSGTAALQYVAEWVENMPVAMGAVGVEFSIDQETYRASWDDEELEYLGFYVAQDALEKDEVRRLRDVAWNNATQRTYRETYQAMEALIHNLNTMHCLRSQAKVWTRLNGDVALLSVGELFERFENEPFEVLSVNRQTHQMEWKSLLKVAKLGAGRDMVKITTASGQEVETTDNHLYLNYEDGAIVDVLAKNVEQVLTPRGFVLNEAQETIDVSGFADVKKNSPFQETTLRVSEELAKLLGLYVGDGSICGGSQMVLTICDKVGEDEVVALVEQALGFKPTYKKLYYGDNKLKEYRFNVGRRIASALKYLCGPCACDKKVPSFVVEGTDAIKKAFLLGYQTADGCKTKDYFEASSVSRDLISGLRFLLLQLKEYPSTGKRLAGTGSVKSRKPLYTIMLGKEASKRLGLVELDVNPAYEAPKYNLRAVSGCGARRRSGNVLYREFEAALESDAELCKKHGALVNYFVGDVKNKTCFNSNDENVYDLSVEDNENFLTEDCVLIHNSRAGAQVPFSSINYGTDTSAAGRMVTECILLALEAGLGNGETPIFPIHIFRVKEGVNFNEGDKNYDLFQLACKVSAKRLFPNFSFQDAPYNLKYYEAGRPETEISYMGCELGSEVKTYRIGGELYVESAERFWKRAAQKWQVKTFGVSEYLDVENVEVYDSSSNGFVKVSRLVKNPDKGDWTRVTFSSGRILYLTEDHALPIEGKGRTLVRDMQLGDAVPAIWNQFAESTPEDDGYNGDTAWALGLILCDGCYKSTLCVSVGLDERDVADKYRDVIEKEFGVKTKLVERRRGVKGNYYDILSIGAISERKKEFEDLFGGVGKKERQIPSRVFRWSREMRLAFLAGIIDADGHVRKNGEVNIGSTNRELAMQEVLLVQSLGTPCKVFCNRYKSNEVPDKIRYKVSFNLTEEIRSALVSGKKRMACQRIPARSAVEDFVRLTKIEKLGTLGESSYCVETESDRFDVSGINSHNCRTRVIGNVYDPENEIAFSRGNLSFTSINLPRLAIEFVANRIQAATTEDAREIFAEDMKLQEKFVGEVLTKLDLCVEQLLERFALQSARTARNFPFLIQQGCWLDGEKLRLDEQVGEILKHGTLSVGFIGLAETLTCLFGRHHGESLESQAFGLYLITKMRDALDAYSRKMKLNFTLLATPAEGLSGRFVKLDRKRYGEIKGVTDKEFYTNSFHIPVDYQISINDKISLEAPYHELTNAGHITYVEVDGDISQNPRAFEKIIRRMKELGVGYGAINHPVDRDPVCGYDGVIEDACPQCGRKETQDQPFERIRRITGYLVGTLARFNDAKRAEESQRVKHQSYGR